MLGLGPTKYTYAFVKMISICKGIVMDIKNKEGIFEWRHGLIKHTEWIMAKEERFKRREKYKGGAERKERRKRTWQRK